LHPLFWRGGREEDGNGVVVRGEKTIAFEPCVLGKPSQKLFSLLQFSISIIVFCCWYAEMVMNAEKAESESGGAGWVSFIDLERLEGHR